LEDFLDLGQHKQAFQQCFRYALSSPDTEVCGFFYLNSQDSNLCFSKVANENLIDPHSFTSSDPSFYTMYSENLVVSLFHSHIKDNYPSELDIESANSFNLPSFIFNVSNRHRFLYYPNNYEPTDLKSRQFIPYFQDCIIYVKDYLLNKFNINLQGYNINWSRNESNSLNQLIFHLDEYFVESSIKNVQNGDLLVFQPNVSIYPHIGIVDDSLVFHHPVYGYPISEFISPELLNKVYKVYRYKDL